ncbi:MAG: glutamate-5-semialdehyde dehydrogenase [Bacteroidetes bacterium]|nr:glutamate-5-semialdehyde dehydrogenase [Bacteroidota bacterium]
MTMSNSTEKTILEQLSRVKQASRLLTRLSDDGINRLILELADLLDQETQNLIAANKLDLARMDPSNPKYDRLLLNEKRIAGMSADLRKVASLPSPLNQILEDRYLPNNLKLIRKSVPLGVIGIIFESRPNVTIDVFALCLKSGNASVLKGSRDAWDSNQFIHSLIQKVLRTAGLEDVCYLAPADRESLPVILNAVGLIDVVIPRGSQGLIDAVRKEARIPVIETGAGIVHTYVDAALDRDMARRVITNAKARRVSVCNALDTLIIHRSVVHELPYLLEELGKKHQVTVYADEDSYSALNGLYSGQLIPAAESDFGVEFLDYKLAVKTVATLDEALDHIARFSSRHSEAVLTADQEAANRFIEGVDAAVVYVNASTAFTDGGEFGLGAEIGISTQKLHARGPMALRELTSYQWVIQGTGQIRA